MKLTERAAVTLLFFLNAVIFTSFFARLPAIKAGLGASDGQLGVALFFATFGLLVAPTLAGALIARLGARGPSLGGLALYALGLPATAAAPSVPVLAAVLLAMGVANGILDVAMNAEGVAVERRSGRRMLSSMHGAFSFGGMTGAGLGGLAAAAGVDVQVHLAAVTALVLAGGVVAATGLPAPHPDAPKGRSFVRPDRRLALLGAVAFCVLLAEGSVTDWSAVYLNESAGASEGLAAAGLTVFMFTMAFGRLAGDRVAERFSAPAVIRVGTLLGAGGLGLALVAAEPAGGIAGYALMGIGLSACFPLVVAASARGSGDAEAASIALVSGAGYVGLTAGPATIGLLSDAVGLRQALLLVVALAVVASALAGAAGSGDSRSAS